MQRKRRDNRTRMQRKLDKQIATMTVFTLFCLFACAVVAFCTVVCKITKKKLKPQEGALKCEIEVLAEIKENKYEDINEYLQPAKIVVGYDYDYVCRVVMAEAGGHSEELQLAICQAIVNRCKKTLENPEEVCKGCYTTPAEKASDSVLNACERVFLLGEEYYGIGNADLMYNPDIAGHSEFHEGQTYVTTIDGVKFFEEN